jgi:GNAT superfamily N-acetyltransferase
MSGTEDQAETRRRYVSEPLEELRALQARLVRQYPVELWLALQGKYITVSKIVVDERRRNEGIGTAVMCAVLDYAGQHGLGVAVSPSTSFGGTRSGLRRFYRRLGFERNRDLAVSESLAIPPGEPAVED